MVKNFDLRQLPRSFRYAGRGLWHVLRTEQNLRIHALAGLAAIGLALYFRISLVELAIVVLAVGLVISAEVLNAIVEDFLDIIHPEHHPTVRRIKDALAGAVLVAALVAAVVGALIFLPYLVAAYR